MGRGAPLGPIAAIMIGAVVCCAAAVAGDNLQDLKAGRIVGATPWRQQVMLAIGAVSCAFVMAPVLNLLEKAYGIGVPSAAHPNPLLAPQATLMASVSKGMFGGALPWGMVWTGVGIGAAIIILDETLKARGARFRTPVLAASFGIYLPLEFTVPIFLGGLIAYFVERKRDVGRDPDALERLHRRGVLFAAGLITGEALMGIVIAIPIVASGRADVLALPERMQPGTSGQWLGLARLAGIAALLYRAARSRGPAQDDP
jgi:putative OPT family oligopeptide transporter